MNDLEYLARLAASQKTTKLGRRRGTKKPQVSEPPRQAPGYPVRNRRPLLPKRAGLDDHGNPNQWCAPKGDYKVAERNEDRSIPRVNVETGG